MTHSGGKPHAVGDRGQRYEVTYMDPGGKRCVFGWSETWVGADDMVKSIDLHPVWEDGLIRDRNADGKGHATNG